ncbi:aminotransferase class I/II-fold pyridoxal phosphate-dependent enzyme [Anthocerotibacter panamensis]|uniref:aminotransferase class I/II-fold pyridoxal phosphate-dependent enzyme n=1 Tax=Anthocerotibacter panamensis TaxID=2857077 RepID=UPI001C40270E|nr:aminotransferase class I/II-fold pyridoxal phosphate-dependent enzyme [Anthocerotibacter panamensis]
MTKELDGAGLIPAPPLPKAQNPSELDLLDQLRAYGGREPLLLCTPGHSQGRFVAPVLQQLLGPALACDLTELAGLDSLQDPEAALAQAQMRAAHIWGADHTEFLVNGATGGLQALLLAALNPGASVLLPRNVHRAVIGALILGGFKPVWLEPVWDEELGIAHGVTVAQVAAQLERHPEVRAVLLVYPTYYGCCAPLTELVALIHRYDLPVLVDSAHGAHLAFHPKLPLCAVAAGCDGVVQSTHKTAGSLTQSAMLHLRGPRLEATRVHRMLTLVQSTSPSYLLLASLIAAADYLHQHGLRRWEEALIWAGQLREALGCMVLEAPPDHTLDPTRLTLRVPVNGFALAAFLEARDIHIELAGLNHLVLLITPAHAAQLLTRLVPALEQGLRELPPLSLPLWPAPPLPGECLDLRAVFFGPQKLVPLPDSIGRVSAQTLVLYPPGIPLVLPAEVVTAELVDYLTTLESYGAWISGWQQPGWLAVVA